MSNNVKIFKCPQCKGKGKLLNKFAVFTPIGWLTELIFDGAYRDCDMCNSKGFIAVNVINQPQSGKS